MDLRIPATDGRPVEATLHGIPEAAPRGLVTINPATAVKRGYYAAFADWLSERGFLVVTFDWRSDADARMRDWGAKDLAGVLAWAQKEHASLPLAGFGHSAGGQMLALADGAERYQAFVGVAAQSGYWRFWEGAGRARRALDWHVLVPTVATLFGRIPRWAGLGEELPAGVAKEWARWCRHPDYVLSEETEARRARLASVRARVLSYSFADDAYGPKAAVDWLAAQLPHARVERRHVSPHDVGAESIGHFGFFRPRFKDTLWREAAAFLEAPRS